jgi:cobalamin synthase
MMMTLKLMNTSQYTEMKRDSKAEVFLIVQVLLWTAIAALLSGGEALKVLLTAGLCLLGTLVSIFMASRELQGMNGDIAGYGILWGELLGIVSLIF